MARTLPGLYRVFGRDRARGREKKRVELARLLEEFRFTLGREISFFYSAGEVAALDLPDAWIFEYVTELIEIRERDRRGAGKRIRGARHDPAYNPPVTIGDDLDDVPKLDASDKPRMF